MRYRELNQDGVGLGLTVSKNLAIALGGDITVDSKIGEGTTFKVTLPAKNIKMPNSPQSKQRTSLIKRERALTKCSKRRSSFGENQYDETVVLEQKREKNFDLLRNLYLKENQHSASNLEEVAQSNNENENDEEIAILMNSPKRNKQRRKTIHWKQPQRFDEDDDYFEQALTSGAQRKRLMSYNLKYALSQVSTALNNIRYRYYHLSNHNYDARGRRLLIPEGIFYEQSLGQNCSLPCLYAKSYLYSQAIRCYFNHCVNRHRIKDSHHISYFFEILDDVRHTCNKPQSQILSIPRRPSSQQYQINSQQISDDLPSALRHFQKYTVKIPNKIRQHIVNFRALLVDDEPFNLMVLEGFFRMIIPDTDITLDLHQAINGEQALQIIRAQQDLGQPIDAVFTDHQMPVMGGNYKQQYWTKMEILNFNIILSALAKNIRDKEMKGEIEKGMPIILVSMLNK